MSKKINNTSKSPNLDWLFGGNPNAIEAQEAKGQQELVNSSQLPANINSLVNEYDIIEQYELLGIQVLGESDDDNLFLDVILPEGWKLIATDHPMWTNLIDENGGKRATIFYKAAFYDRNAHINFNRRYYVEPDYSIKNEISYKVIDNKTNKTIFQTNSAIRNVEGNNNEFFKLTNAYNDMAKDYLNTNYPLNQDCNAYWNE